MAQRAPRKESPYREVARQLYVEEQLSLQEISRQTGKNIKTLRAWRNLEDWDTLKEQGAKTELDRLKDLRNSLLDRAEAQLKEGKLPHTEIGLMYKLEKMIEQREQKQHLPETVALYAFKHFGSRLIQTDKELYYAFRKILLEFSGSISETGFPRPPK